MRRLHTVYKFINGCWIQVREWLTPDQILHLKHIKIAAKVFVACGGAALIAPPSATIAPWEHGPIVESAPPISVWRPGSSPVWDIAPGAGPEIISGGGSPGVVRHHEAPPIPPEYLAFAPQVEGIGNSLGGGTGTRERHGKAGKALTPVPEPSSLWLLISTIAVLTVIRRKQHDNLLGIRNRIKQ